MCTRTHMIIYFFTNKLKAANIAAKPSSYFHHNPVRWERTGAFLSDNNRRDARPVEFLPACLVLVGAKGGAKQLPYCPPLDGAASSDWLPQPRQRRRGAGPPRGHAPSPFPHSSINFYLRGGGREGLASPEIGHRRAAPARARLRTSLRVVMQP